MIEEYKKIEIEEKEENKKKGDISHLKTKKDEKNKVQK